MQTKLKIKKLVRELVVLVIVHLFITLVVIPTLEIVLVFFSKLF